MAHSSPCPVLDISCTHSGPCGTTCDGVGRHGSKKPGRAGAGLRQRMCLLSQGSSESESAKNSTRPEHVGTSAYWLGETWKRPMSKAQEYHDYAAECLRQRLSQKIEIIGGPWRPAGRLLRKRALRNLTLARGRHRSHPLRTLRKAENRGSYERGHPRLPSEPPFPVHVLKLGNGPNCERRRSNN